MSRAFRAWNAFNAVPQEAQSPRDLFMAGFDAASADAKMGMPSPVMMTEETTACRDNARSMINRKIGELRTRANELEKLSESLPMVLSPEADEALWRLLIGAA